MMDSTRPFAPPTPIPAFVLAVVGLTASRLDSAAPVVMDLDLVVAVLLLSLVAFHLARSYGSHPD